MKQLLLLLTFCMSLPLLYGGYVIRGIYTPAEPENLKNFTLLVKNGIPASAASVHTTGASGSGKNTIVIISSDPTVLPVFFPIIFIDEDYDIEVKDFHYQNDKYILCGFRKSEIGLHAFVAEISVSTMLMSYNEYIEVERFYSICVPNNLLYNYYAVGNRGSYGVIAEVSRGNLHITNSLITKEEWEYHKIIAKPNNVMVEPHFIISGRNTVHSRIGFTLVDWQLMNPDSYIWPEITEDASLCVVCDYYTENNKIVLASSYSNSVTLNPITLPVSSINAYRFNFPNATTSKYYIQDIGMLGVVDVANPRISVAGYTINPVIAPPLYMAWYGFVLGLSNISRMDNNYYLGSPHDQYQHYKLRGDGFGHEYTGGYYQGNIDGNLSMCALFGSPLKNSPDCDHPYRTPTVIVEPRYWGQFDLMPYETPHPNFETFYFDEEPMYIFEKCDELLRNLSPEFVMTPPENETKITNFYDCISVKDIRANTKYQIYTITGQLIQTGSTTPDISTAQLSKGMYFLRLENGKAFKFVK